MDEFILDADTSRSMKTRLLRGAMQYVGGTARFKTDDRLIFLENVSASIRGTNFLAIIGSRIQFVLISGAVELGARSNSITHVAALIVAAIWWCLTGQAGLTRPRSSRMKISWRLARVLAWPLTCPRCQRAMMTGVATDRSLTS